MNEVCAECDYNSRYNDSNRDDYYLAWVGRMFQLWHENIDIRLAERTGYGLYARKSLAAKIFIGEYTGVLLPIDEELPDENTVYQFVINIGKLQTKRNAPQPKCWVDATKKGSIFRLMAHSCSPNAEVTEAHVSTHNRVLAVRTIRPVLANEAITIDYGERWLTGKQRYFCGVQGCTNPLQAGDSDLSDDNGSEYEEQDI